jgi:hypothetical protein
MDFFFFLGYESLLESAENYFSFINIGILFNLIILQD